MGQGEVARFVQSRVRVKTCYTYHGPRVRLCTEVYNLTSLAICVEGQLTSRLVQADFLYYSVPGNVQIPIFAGLLPIDLRTLITIPASDLSMYFAIWTASLLSNTRYAVDIPFDACSETCRSLILPGGFEMARQFNSSLKYTIFDGGLLNDTETVRIENAPGMILTFETLRSDFLFNPDSASGD